MELNTSLLDYSRFNKILNQHRGDGTILVNVFLERFYELYDKFKETVLDDTHRSRHACETASQASQLGAFIRKTGGTRAADMLAEYERYASIADFVSCSQMEKSLFEEIDAFREIVVSMFS